MKTVDIAFKRTDRYVMRWQNTPHDIVCLAQDAVYGDGAEHIYPVRFTTLADKSETTESVYSVMDVDGVPSIVATRESTAKGTPGTGKEYQRQSYEGLGYARYLPAEINEGDIGSWESTGGWNWGAVEEDGTYNPSYTDGLYRYKVAWRMLFGRLEVSEWWAQWGKDEPEPAQEQFFRYEVFDVKSGSLGFRDEISGQVVIREDLIPK